MKRLFFLLPVLFFLNASAQQPYYDFKKFQQKNDSSYIFPLDKKISIDSLKKLMEKAEIFRTTKPMGKLIYTQPNGTRIFALPQDNMICLVPDMSQFNMPVISKGLKITGMPPDAKPPIDIIPEKD